MKGKILTFLTFIIFTLGWFSMGYSRYILGVHSSAQLLYGFLLGAWSAFLAIKYINPKLREIGKYTILVRDTPIGEIEMQQQDGQMTKIP